MDIGVLVKASLDVNMVKSTPEGLLAAEQIPLAISEYDRNAVAEAVRIRDSIGGRVIVFSVLTWGPIDRREREFENVVREALALGGDEAHVLLDNRVINGGIDATVVGLEGLIRRFRDVRLILCGEASMDGMSSQIPIRLASRLGYNVVTFAREIEVDGDRVRVTRDLEDAIQVIETTLPIVISVTGEINQPRLPTLLQIRRAFMKPYNKYSLDTLGVSLPGNLLTPLEYRIVTIARKNVLIEDGSPEEVADKLIDRLIEEGVLKR